MCISFQSLFWKKGNCACTAQENCQRPKLMRFPSIQCIVTSPGTLFFEEGLIVHRQSLFLQHLPYLISSHPASFHIAASSWVTCLLEQNKLFIGFDSENLISGQESKSFTFGQKIIAIRIIFPNVWRNYVLNEPWQIQNLFGSKCRNGQESLALIPLEVIYSFKFTVLDYLSIDNVRQNQDHSSYVLVCSPDCNIQCRYIQLHI